MWHFNLSLLLFLLSISFAGTVPMLQAQTIREKAKKHVEESLEKSTQPQKEDSNYKKKKKDEKKNQNQISNQQKGYAQSKGTRTGNTVYNNSTQENVVSLEISTDTTNKNEDLPKRVIHKKFKLDISGGAGYRAWVPQQYPTVATNMANYFTWNVDVKAKLFGWLNLSRGYYESTGAANPRPSEMSDAARYGSYALTAAWLILSLGFPIGNVWEPTIKYEARAFKAHAKAKNGKNVCIVPYNSSADVEQCPTTEQEMMIDSTYETALLGVNYFPGKEPTAIIHSPKKKFPSFFFGLGYIGYVKPYQITIGTETLEEYLFTGRFRGGGIALGMSYNGGVNNIFFDGWIQLGLGETRLTKDMTLNELAPEDWLLGYLGGNLKFGGRIALWKFAPTLMFVPEVSAGGASFFFFKIRTEEGEKVSTPTVNWDFLYTIRASLVLTL